jgi:hypothetical protein
MTTQVSNPLTLVMTIKSPADRAALQATIEHLQALPPESNPIATALKKIATVHFARFVFLNDSQLAVITTYDDSFDRYVDAFVDEIGMVFDKLLVHMKDAPPLPVADNREAFLQYVKKNDIPCVPPFFSAYPDLKVLDILTLQRQHAKD